ncbi:MAG: hypothetical protein AAFO93_09360 [Pseudomonadota bacterium]
MADQRMTMDRRAFILGAPALLAACSTKPVVFAPAEDVARVRYVHDGPPELTVFTSFNTGSDNGAHSALFINASQRVIFDPAGTFAHPKIPEQHDVLYGANPQVMRAFVDYHTRITYWTRTQSVVVPAAAAEYALRQAQASGPVPDALCTRRITEILSSAPGFPGAIKTTWFPDKLSAQMATVPGVVTREFRQTDDADKEKFWETFEFTTDGKA